MKLKSKLSKRYFLSTSGNNSILRMLESLVSVALLLLAPTLVRAQVVDSIGTVGLYTSCAVNTAAGTVHISYYDATGDNLKHAWKPITGAVWTTETVDSLGNVGKYTSIAADSGGGLHISYYAVTSFLGTSLANLKYAHKPPGGPWSISAVDTPGNVGKYSSIAVNPFAGTVHISYYDDTGDNLKHAWKPIGYGAWTPEFVDTAGDVGRYTSIAVGPSGNVHISYYNVTTADLKHAWKSYFGGGAWSGWMSETVDAFGDAGKYSSIAVDSASRVHISYHWASQGDLKYAVKQGTWTLAFVDLVGTTGQHTSIAINYASGMVAISYYDATLGNLKHAMKPIAGGIGGVWAISTLDSAGTVGKFTSTRASLSGVCHISYYNVSTGDLKYATVP